MYKLQFDGTEEKFSNRNDLAKYLAKKHEWLESSLQKSLNELNGKFHGFEYKLLIDGTRYVIILEASFKTSKRVGL